MNKQKLLLFAKMIDNNYYFTKCREKNHWEWAYDSDDHIIIYGDDPMSISGVGDIGKYADALDLCCSTEFNFYTRRVEIHVH